MTANLKDLQARLKEATRDVETGERLDPGCYASVTVEDVEEAVALLARIEELEEVLGDATAHLVAAASAYDKHASRHKDIRPRAVADAFFTTRSSDFTKAASRARAALSGAMVERFTVEIDMDGHKWSTVPDPQGAYVRFSDYETLRSELEVVNAQVYVPGEFRCPKCQFTLSQFRMSAVDGSIGERDEPGEKCPNDGSPLWRVTWKDRAHEHYERAVEEIQRANAADKAAEDATAKIVIEVEKLLLAKLGREWTPDGISIRSLIDELALKENDGGE